MAHRELNLRERRAIEDMLNAKIAVREIAAEIDRHVSTVYREIKRNHYDDKELPELNEYYGMVAQRAASQRRARRRKLVRLAGLRKAVIKQLKEGWSPEQIAGRLQFEGQSVRVSHETIYAYVYGPDGRSKQLARHLPSRRKNRRSRYARRPRGQVFPPDRSIHQRPEHVKTRETFGEWEGDLMIFEGAQGKMNVASLVERKTRFAVLFRNNDRSSTHFINKLMGVMEPLPQTARRSITFDRGFEFREWRKLKPGIGTEAWFCDPQAPWQKGSVENLNKRARRYLPRDAPVAALTNRDMKSICERLNGTPRKCLGWRTPTEVFREELMKLR
ncbi:IS30 family transposase [Sulfitobacter mediterraneus]|uniref:IS30 family transposase n=1 Tax=Sulfitobacter mediterraneus TaxID=83219 RepID=UPI0019325251|nr:IS30 family transposase [Sulfitobacter mediterraneus]MBM1635133.1 IS30 family transposase [Sulfitobacter mediterraneus]MBM1642957.1 IS30 family transposase [Sulfitobacter mediterraneus]MBM1647005.1 IS30 family transposase [Sulfitobacter mediterraneus]MBM1651047.1 IS30 family transposase [Sulfitobacter mediterraneus]MBM1655052.1 IS30 family transposase [Sulfitobacter mediterraneus]